MAMLSGRTDWTGASIGRSVTIFAALLFIFWLFIAGFRPLSVPDEGRYSEIAREMIVKGDFITPRLNGVIFLDKPVLHYWLQACSFYLLGVNNWSVRLMPVLFGVSGAILVFVTGWRLFNFRAAILATLVLVSSPLYFLSTQYANMDLEISTCVTATLCLFLLGRRESPGSWKHRSLFWLAWFAVGCGILTKGLIGLVFPLMIIGVWVLIGWRWKELKNMHIVSGCMMASIVCLPWYWLVQEKNPGFFHYFFIYQQFERFSGSGFNNEFPVWFYVPVLFLGLFPWVYWAPKMFYNQLRCLRGDSKLPGEDNRQLLLIWPVLIFIFFSIPHSKITGYILPVLPPLALLLGDYLDRRLVLCEKNSGILPKLFICSAAIGILISLTVLVAAAHFEKEGTKDISLELKSRLRPGDQIVFYEKYYYDLPLYLQNIEPLKIVEEWDNDTIMQEDNWHHDLNFGLQNDPSVRRWLISHEELPHLLASPDMVYILANPSGAKALQRQYSLSVISRSEKTVLLVSAHAH